MDVARRQHPLGQRHLQGHFAAQQPIPRPDHEPEAARPEVVDDLEAAQHRAIVVTTFPTGHGIRVARPVRSRFGRFQHGEQEQ